MGDPRRERRARAILDSIIVDPSASFPKLLASDKELEAFYRFVENPYFEPEALLHPHVLATVARCQIEGAIVVAHDTTDCHFSGAKARKGLGATNSSNQGFLAHVSFALTGDDRRLGLGTLAVETFVRTGEKKASKPSEEKTYDPTSESHRWLRQLLNVEKLFGQAGRVIHVADRESDIYSLLAEATVSGARFVFRSAQNRTLLPSEDATATVLEQAIGTLEPAAFREISISARGQGLNPKARKAHPPREARSATVAIAGTRVCISRPRENPSPHASATLNVVRVWEPSPPGGEEPIDWVLLTSEPIGSPEDLQQIVDWYASRWVIEELFKALKTGCSLEQRQLESYDALLKAFCLFLPIAWRLLLLRTVARIAPQAPADAVLTSSQVELLNALPDAGSLPAMKAALASGQKRSRPIVTARDALLAIAKLGGHLLRNGEPGWQTIGRGFEQLAAFEIGWGAAVAAPPTNPPKITRKTCDQS